MRSFQEARESEAHDNRKRDGNEESCATVLFDKHFIRRDVLESEASTAALMRSLRAGRNVAGSLAHREEASMLAACKVLSRTETQDAALFSSAKASRRDSDDVIWSMQEMRREESLEVLRRYSFPSLGFDCLQERRKLRLSAMTREKQSKHLPQS
jgi:hypothetical protein